MRSRATGRSVGCLWLVIPFILNWNGAAKVVAAALGLFLISAPLFSQGNAGRILGVVTDQQGAAVPGVNRNHYRYATSDFTNSQNRRRGRIQRS